MKTSYCFLKIEQIDLHNRKPQIVIFGVAIALKKKKKKSVQGDLVI